jgi:hypothetical protein
VLSKAATFSLFIVLIIAFVPFCNAISWSLDIRLTTDISWEMAPSIIQAADGKVWVAWHSDKTGNEDIFYKTYEGSSWSSDSQLTTDGQNDMNPSLMQAQDGRIWAVFDTDRSLLDEDIYYKVFDGASWSADIPLVVTLLPDKNPSITQTVDGKIWVVWSSVRTGDPEIYYKFFDGSSWSNETQLTTDQNHDDEDPAIMQARNGVVWVVWSKTLKSAGKTGDIYYKTFDGSFWSADTQLTTDTYDDLNPTIMQSVNDRIWVTWNSNRKANNNNIFYKIFDGASWTDDTQLTNAMEHDKTPSITQITNGSIWIVWASRRVLSQFDLYYRLGMELHDVAVLSVTLYASHTSFGYRGEIIYVEVGVQNDGEAKEAIEVRCYADTTLIKSRSVSLASGEYHSMVFQWNTTGVKPGPRVISAEVMPVLGETDVADNSLTDGTVEVRIFGDIVGMYSGSLQPIPDGRVDIDDFGMTIGHYGCKKDPAWPHPAWDSVADVDENLVIDLDDIMLVGAHFGEI